MDHRGPPDAFVRDAVGVADGQGPDGGKAPEELEGAVGQGAAVAEVDLPELALRGKKELAGVWKMPPPPLIKNQNRG